jgi:hypothetical protein
MTYFSYLPYTGYELDNQIHIVKDILKRSQFLTEFSDLTALYYEYEIQDGETVQSVAMKFYDSPAYHWVVMMFNEIHNLYAEWPLDQINLQRVLEEKYGVALNAIKHWEKNEIIVGFISEFVSAATWISPENPGVPNNMEYNPVTFYEYETKLNDSKRLIRLLKPELLGEFVKQFSDSMNV